MLTLERLRAGNHRDRPFPTFAMQTGTGRRADSAEFDAALFPNALRVCRSAPWTQDFGVRPSRCERPSESAGTSERLTLLRQQPRIRPIEGARCSGPPRRTGAGRRSPAASKGVPVERLTARCLVLCTAIGIGSGCFEASRRTAMRSAPRRAGSGPRPRPTIALLSSSWGACG